MLRKDTVPGVPNEKKRKKEHQKKETVSLFKIASLFEARHILLGRGFPGWRQQPTLLESTKKISIYISITHIKKLNTYMESTSVG
jgi:hypothetical protein